MEGRWLAAVTPAPAGMGNLGCYHVWILIRMKINAYDNNFKSCCRMLSNKPPTGNSLSHFLLFWLAAGPFKKNKIKDYKHWLICIWPTHTLVFKQNRSDQVMPVSQERRDNLLMGEELIWWWLFFSAVSGEKYLCAPFPRGRENVESKASRNSSLEETMG